MFRFGNHQTLTSKQALLFPLHDQWLRIAVVPGPTPFLLSSTFLNQIRAVIDTEAGTLWSKMLKKQLVLERTAKNLFLMDVNQLWEPTATACLTTSVGSDEFQNHAAEKPCTFGILAVDLEFSACGILGFFEISCTTGIFPVSLGPCTHGPFTVYAIHGSSRSLGVGA